jgi:hypothetical protein
MIDDSIVESVYGFLLLRNNSLGAGVLRAESSFLTAGIFPCTQVVHAGRQGSRRQLASDPFWIRMTNEIYNSEDEI